MKIYMEHLTLHHLSQNMNDRTMTRQHEAIHNEKARRFQTWPVARLLQIIYNNTPNYMERSSNLTRLCDVRHGHGIEPVMTCRLNTDDPTMMLSDVRQDLLDLLAFKEWYANDDIPKIDPIDVILKRYPVQALKNQINALSPPPPPPPPACYQRHTKHLTSYGPHTF
jgi:hypothetical protein